MIVKNLRFVCMTEDNRAIIEQAKDLKSDAEETVDPIVEVKCLGKRKFTTA